MSHFDGKTNKYIILYQSNKLSESFTRNKMKSLILIVKIQHPFDPNIIIPKFDQQFSLPNNYLKSSTLNDKKELYLVLIVKN